MKKTNLSYTTSILDLSNWADTNQKNNFKFQFPSGAYCYYNSKFGYLSFGTNLSDYGIITVNHTVSPCCVGDDALCLTFAYYLYLADILISGLDYTKHKLWSLVDTFMMDVTYNISGLYLFELENQGFLENLRNNFIECLMAMSKTNKFMDDWVESVYERKNTYERHSES